MPLMVMPDGDADKRRVRDRVGDVSGVQLFGNRVLVGIYLRGDKTQSGIYLPDRAKDEDMYQGKTALVLAMGPDAFMDSANYQFKGDTPRVDDWVVIRVGESWPVDLNNKEGHCRIVLDQDIAMMVPRPDLVW